MQMKLSFSRFNKQKSQIEVLQPAGIIFDKRAKQKAYEILGIDVSTQKASQLLGIEVDGWRLPASQIRAQENITRKLQRSPDLSRKALKILGIEESMLVE